MSLSSKANNYSTNHTENENNNETVKASEQREQQQQQQQQEFFQNFSLPPRLFQNNPNLTLECIDCHAGGEPARIILNGLPHIPGQTSYEKRNYMMKHYDFIRQVLLCEPRGYPCQNVNFIFDPPQPQPQKKGAVLQYVIAEQGKIYPAMSGHNTICVATALLECNILPMIEPITKFTLEAPAGPIAITAKCSHGKAQSITFQNEPSFVEALDIEIDVPSFGKVKVDIAYGGMWYAIVDAASVNLTLHPSKGKEICRLGEMVKVATREQYPVQHPLRNYPGVDILVFRGPPSSSSEAHAQNAVVMTNQRLDWEDESTWTGMLDRSPCGTGTCAIMAVLHAKGELAIGEKFIHESIVGSIFEGVLIQELKGEEEGGIVGKTVVIPEITGSAVITQYCRVVVDPEDPFPNGFTVGDIW